MLPVSSGKGVVCTERKSVGDERDETEESDCKRRLRKAVVVAEKFKCKYLLEQQVSIELARTCSGLRNQITVDREVMNSMKCEIERLEVKLCLTEAINKLENGRVPIGAADDADYDDDILTSAAATSTLKKNTTFLVCENNTISPLRYDIPPSHACTFPVILVSPNWTTAANTTTATSITATAADTAAATDTYAMSTATANIMSTATANAVNTATANAVSTITTIGINTMTANAVDTVSADAVSTFTANSVSTVTANAVNTVTTKAVNTITANAVSTAAADTRADIAAVKSAPKLFEHFLIVGANCDVSKHWTIFRYLLLLSLLLLLQLLSTCSFQNAYC